MAMDEDEITKKVSAYFRRRIEETKPDLPITREKKMLILADHVDELILFCSVYMPDVPKYYRGSKAFWAIVHMLGGNDEKAHKLIAEIEDH